MSPKYQGTQIINEEGKQEKQDYIINRQDFVAITAKKASHYQGLMPFS